MTIKLIIMSKIPRSCPKGIHLFIGGLIGGITSLFVSFLLTNIISTLFNERLFEAIIAVVAGFGGFIGFWLALYFSPYDTNELMFKGKTRFDQYLPSWPTMCLMASIFFAAILFATLNRDLGINIPISAGGGGLIGAWIGGVSYIKGGLIKTVFGFFGGGIGLVMGTLIITPLNNLQGGLLGLLVGYSIGGIIGLVVEDQMGIIVRQ